MIVTNKARITEKMYRTSETEGTLPFIGIEPVVLGEEDGPVVDDEPGVGDRMGVVSIKSIDGVSPRGNSGQGLQKAGRLTRMYAP